MNNEIIVDNFAGGGGASTGIEMAIGRSVDIAINHDPNAVAMHTTNHPDTLHYCESVFTVNPKIVTAGRPVALAWYSPDCRHFSKAKGAKPVEKSIRGLAWIALRWGLEVKPRVMMLENVGEFRTWGPLLAGEMRPDPERTGETFEAFVGMLTTGIPADHPALVECCEFLEIDIHSEQANRLVNGLGYTVEYRELRACDYGAPTIRKRFFMVARCDGQPVVWPEPTHGDPKSESVKSGRLKPWRTAAECIDWSIPAPSIFGRKKPLAENTLKRIARGIQRFVINNASPFIVKCNHTSTKTSYDCFRGQGLQEPLQTITKKHGYAVAVPHLTKFRTGAMGQNVTDPAPTITAGTSTRPGGNGHALGIVEAALTPFLAGNGGSEYQAKPRPLDKPAHTILKQSRACLIAPVITRQFGASIGHRADEPGATVTAGGGGKSQLTTATLIQMGYGERPGQQPRVLQLGKPLGTVTAGGVVYRIVDIGMRMLQPRELYRAQGFPDWYIIEHDFRGVKYAKDKQVARCGNAVPPQFAEALVRANLPELCVNGEGIAA
ncbi:DNA cytosine methyltransferase [Salmonella enterica subsp. enterica serovar Florida]|nr:DNA cytosine methyltransferase [Salmonella enterica]EED8352071.1 DNA cytosine methyltransferase [Salmonella enterica subsp. enterica serovar Florida]EBB2461420.1 DNA cytosine methyltransferase [Salmonella enterica]ECK4960071.1 DNA cytosine methyltransferase [Salmonella enterica]EEA3680536.1 DNA cytosine methyltransferase [Salmonella enterica]